MNDMFSDIEKKLKDSAKFTFMRCCFCGCHSCGMCTDWNGTFRSACCGNLYVHSNRKSADSLRFCGANHLHERYSQQHRKQSAGRFHG